MSLPTDPTTQLARLVELNTDIATAQVDLNQANTTALEAAQAAGRALVHMTDLEAARDELLETMKEYTAEPQAEAV